MATPPEHDELHEGSQLSIARSHTTGSGGSGTVTAEGPNENQQTPTLYSQGGRLLPPQQPTLGHIHTPEGPILWSQHPQQYPVPPHHHHHYHHHRDVTELDDLPTHIGGDIHEVYYPGSAPKRKGVGERFIGGFVKGLQRPFKAAFKKGRTNQPLVPGNEGDLVLTQPLPSEYASPVSPRIPAEPNLLYAQAGRQGVTSELSYVTMEPHQHQSMAQSDLPPPGPPIDRQMSMTQPLNIRNSRTSRRTSRASSRRSVRRSLARMSGDNEATGEDFDEDQIVGHEVVPDDINHPPSAYQRPRPQREPTAMTVEPALAEDYDKMERPPTSSTHIRDETFEHIASVRHFLRTIKAMPWFTSDGRRVAADYIPSRRESPSSPRTPHSNGRISRTSRASRASWLHQWGDIDGAASWYTPARSRSQILDLMADPVSPTTPRSPRIGVSVSQPLPTRTREAPTNGVPITLPDLNGGAGFQYIYGYPAQPVYAVPSSRRHSPTYHKGRRNHRRRRTDPPSLVQVPMFIVTPASSPATNPQPMVPPS